MEVEAQVDPEDEAEVEVVAQVDPEAGAEVEVEAQVDPEAGAKVEVEAQFDPEAEVAPLFFRWSHFEKQLVPHRELLPRTQHEFLAL